MTWSHSPAHLLAPGYRIADIVDSCRYGALAFLNGVLAEWGKNELAAWLAGPYADVTRFGESPTPRAAFASAPRHLAPYAVSRVMREAHEEVVETLRVLAQPDGGVSFAYGALDVLVVRCVESTAEGEGAVGFAPAATPRMRLADRVLALIATDYLTRPEDYEESLAICTRCRLVGFDAAARARGVCRVHSVSGIRFRDSDIAQLAPPKIA